MNLFFMINPMLIFLIAVVCLYLQFDDLISVLPFYALVDWKILSKFQLFWGSS